MYNSVWYYKTGSEGVVDEFTVDEDHGVREEVPDVEDGNLLLVLEVEHVVEVFAHVYQTTDDWVRVAAVVTKLGLDQELVRV